MDDLIEQFFKRDLTEAEEGALSGRLASSVEDALLFGRQAEKAYLASGLPEPVWKGDPNSWPLPPLGWKPMMGFWVLLLALGVGIGWMAQEKIAEEEPLGAPKAYTQSSASKNLKAIPPGVSLKKTRHPSVAKPFAPTLPGSLSGTPMASLSAKKAGSKPILPVSTPIDLGAHPHQTYSNLSVVINRSTPGPITVRVLSPDGTEVVLLYQGLLQAGSWVFEWDGRLVDGQTAGPGTYQIEVRSGSIAQKKAIQIK